MAAHVRFALQSVVVALAAAFLLAGCATRFDAQGRQIYVWQFGQDTDRAIDYSNPRLPLLPKWRPKEQLWPVPSPYDFTDLSPFSFVAPQEGLGDVRVSDNAARAASCISNARPALPASCADVRSRSSIVLAAR